MYRVKVDGESIHDPIQGKTISMATVTQAANCADQFVFTIYPDNIGYEKIKRHLSIIEVYDDQDCIFRGRAINDTIGWLNQKTITCESDFALLNDSILRPYQFKGSVERYFRTLLEWHNSQMAEDKRIYPRTVTVKDDNDLIVRGNSNYPSTMTELQDKLIDKLGGYIIIERVDGVNYADYLAESPYASTQKIQVRKNLLDYKRNNKGESIATALIPLGAQDGDHRITIESVNNGLDYIVNEEAAEKYGVIFATAIWDDVTVPANLLRKGQEMLKTMTGTSSLELTAVDMHQADASIEGFRLLQNVEIEDNAHNVSGRYLITKKVTSLDNPANNKITIGWQKTGIIDVVDKNSSKMDQAIQTVKDYSMNAIEKATDQITGVNGGFVVIHRDDESGKPYEILIMDTDDISTAVNVWRWNKNGWGHSANGYEGPYDLAATQDGSIIADAIETGVIQSRDYIEGKQGFRINIDTGRIEAPSLTLELTDTVTSEVQAQVNASASGITETIKKETRYIITYQYAVSSSGTTPPASGWSASMPEKHYGEYLWRKEVMTYGDGTESWKDPVVISGSDGRDGEDAVLLQVISSNGQMFKNSAVSTTLAVNIIVGGTLIASSMEMYDFFGPGAYIAWKQKMYGETQYTEIDAADPRISDHGFLFTINVEDVQLQAVYSCELYY